MIAVELFCCSGGMAEGFRRAGLGFDLVVDADPFACASYGYNLGHAPLCADVRALDPGAFPTVDLLVADPPCTPWSTAGKGLGLADPRDCLLPTARLIAGVRPTAWLIANVPGLELRRAAAARAFVFGPLEAAGYCVDYARFDCADYGVPQRRHRPFWFGHPRGTPCLAWPRPTHARPAYAAALGLAPWVTCRAALADFAPAELGRPVVLRWARSKDHRVGALDAPARTITRNAMGDGVLLDGAIMAHTTGHPPSFVDSPANTITQREGRGGTVLTFSPKHPPNLIDAPSRTIGGKARDNGPSILEWPWDRPATTVQADPRLAPPGHHAGSDRSTVAAVVLSEAAAKRLQGFPDKWVTLGPSKRARWALIGQAMPPPMAAAVAASIAGWFKEHG